MIPFGGMQQAFSDLGMVFIARGTVVDVYDIMNDHPIADFKTRHLLH